MNIRAVEVFAGAGGLSLGIERAGIECILHLDNDRDSCDTLRMNRPDWKVVQRDIGKYDFTKLKGKAQILAGGFPCQPFSYLGNKFGFQDMRGTAFFEMCRAAEEMEPEMIIMENVKGLINHDGGRTLKTITTALKALGYSTLQGKLMNALHHEVAQDRWRFFIVAHKGPKMAWGRESKVRYTLSEALGCSRLYYKEVPKSKGAQYKELYAKAYKLIPEGGNWRDLPVDMQRVVMGGAFGKTTGGNSGFFRRLAWDKPAPTITGNALTKACSRCHPVFTRPLTTRECARVQSFPDDWHFAGKVTSQYQQIGNAVPMNLARDVVLACHQHLLKVV